MRGNLSDSSGTMSLSLLPDDLLWDFALSYAAVLLLADVAQFAATCGRVREILRPVVVAVRRLPDCRWAADVTRLEQLAVWESIQKLESLRIRRPCWAAAPSGK
eukprot:6351251-Prymnesium_polylepis.2